MILTEIINFSKNLSAYDEDVPHTLSFNIVDAYYQHLTDVFSDLFSAHRKIPYILERFEQILSDNWHLVKGTTLCYTATPNFQATRLCYEIAQYIQHKKKQTNALLYLMPTINPESLSDEYPNLSTLSLEEIIDTHILSKNGRYLIPVKLLTTLDIPTLTEAPLYNPYFHEQLHDTSNCVIHSEELERLFQHSEETERIRTHRDILKNLMQDQNNLLGQLNLLCDSLRHGSVFENGEEHQADDIAHDGLMYFTSFYNQLFSKELHLLQTLPVSLEDFEGQYIWLNDQYLYYINHSLEEIIINVESFKATLITLLKNQNNPSGKIQLTPYEMNQLFIDTSHHWLDPNLPKGLHNEIMFLIQLSTNLESNHEARRNTEACVVKRREALLFYIKAHSHQLSLYTLQNNDQESNLEIAKQNFIDAQNELLDKLIATEYIDGFDKLEKFSHLIRQLHIDYQIQQIEDLEIFKYISANELNKIFNTEQLKYEAILMIPNLNECAALIQDFKPVSLINFLEILDEKLNTYILPTIIEINELLKVVDSEKAGIIIQHLHHFYTLNTASFIDLISGQSHEHFRIVCATLKNVLLESMALGEFILIYEALETMAHKASFVECFISDFPSLIEDTFDYINLKTCLSQTEDHLLFDLMLPKFEKIISNINDFTKILEQLDNGHRRIFLNKLHPIIPGITETPVNLNLLFAELNPDEVGFICESEHSLIKTFLINLDNTMQIILNLDEHKQNIIHDHFKNEIFFNLLNSNHSYLDIPSTSILSKTSQLTTFTRNIIQLSGSKIATNFSLSLLNDDLYTIKDNFNRFFDSRPYYRFFQSNNNLDQILFEIYQLPNEFLRKLLRSLELNENTKYEDFITYVYQNRPEEMSFKKIKC